jgi:hypothetical protein
MYAHYFKKGKDHYMVISETNVPCGRTIKLGCKQVVKKYAKENNLKAWNF